MNIDPHNTTTNANIPPFFGVVLVGKSFSITSDQFTRVDELRWILDVRQAVCFDYTQLKEVCIFLLHHGAIADNMALGVYVTAHGSEFEYRGAVSNSNPSASLSLQWPTKGPAGTREDLPVQLGISIEPIEALAGNYVSLSIC